MTLYDLILYRIADDEVTGLVIGSVTYDKAENALIAVMQTIDEEYCAAIVDSGSHQVGDKLTENVKR